MLLAILCAFAIKEPLIVLARQAFVWKQPHPETRLALRFAAVETVMLAAFGTLIVLSRSWRPFALLAGGAASFTLIAVAVNVKNRQRSVWFQIASAAALTSTSVAACLAVLNGVPRWCWLLWVLSALQAFGGILVVHARLDARIGLRKPELGKQRSRRVAMFSQLALALAGVAFGVRGYTLIAIALFFAASAYFFDMYRQKDSESLQMSLKSVGKQALTVSICFAIMIIVGLWRTTI